MNEVNKTLIKVLNDSSIEKVLIKPWAEREGSEILDDIFDSINSLNCKGNATIVLSPSDFDFLNENEAPKTSDRLAEFLEKFPNISVFAGGSLTIQESDLMTGIGGFVSIDDPTKGMYNGFCVFSEDGNAVIKYGESISTAKRRIVLDFEETEIPVKEDNTKREDLNRIISESINSELTEIIPVDSNWEDKDGEYILEEIKNAIKGFNNTDLIICFPPAIFQILCTTGYSNENEKPIMAVIRDLIKEFNPLNLRWSPSLIDINGSRGFCVSKNDFSNMKIFVGI